MWRDGKYLIAYAMPLTALLGLFLGNNWTFLGVGFAFGFIPLVETFATGTKENIATEMEEKRSKEKFFDLLLYFNLPLLCCILLTYFQKTPTYNLTEFIGATLSVGLMVGALGINVAHELGHRTNPNEQRIAKLLLLPALYIHFIIEHNRGHHKNVATDLDPASARFGESIYAFWVRAVMGEYRSAWHLEVKRLEKANLPFWSWKNDMIRFHLYEIAYLALIAYCYGLTGFLTAIMVAAIGVLLLESTNYIEHYGLRRKKLPTGHYEKVMPWHSWNSNHELGRIILYELTRHSDHHFKASRKFQILKYHEKSPQLPFGYPSSILISLIPPVWFSIMNKKVLALQE
jgi:alkane 1-monooxygenase